MTPHGTIMTLFHMTLGDFQYGEFEHTTYPGVTKFVFIIFMLLMPILLLNMLIAMMGNTFTSIVAKSEKEWIRQWAKIVLVIERSFSQKKLLEYQRQYSVPVDNPPPIDAEYMSKFNIDQVRLV